MYTEAFDPNRSQVQTILIPPDVVAATTAQLEAALRSAGADSDDNMKYAYQHLKDHLSVCAVVVRAGKVEISPPFLPSLALDIFDRKVRRVYLSATLNNKADIVRAFGRMPAKIVEPRNDAGNGERLILFERGLFQRDQPVGKIDSYLLNPLPDQGGGPFMT